MRDIDLGITTLIFLFGWQKFALKLKAVTLFEAMVLFCAGFLC